MQKNHSTFIEPSKQQGPVKRLFVDMDGTLAEFIPTEKLEDLYERYYFLNLRPMSEVVSAIRSIVTNRPDIEVFILSSVLADSQYAKEEKNAWLNIWLPEIDDKHRLFPHCGEIKIDSVPFIGDSADYLLDDYTKNLLEWDSACGIGIKLLNGINNTRGTWRGLRVSSSRPAKSLYYDLMNIIDYEVSQSINIQAEELEL